MTNNIVNTQFNDAEALVKAQQFPAALQVLNKLVKAIPDHQGALYLKAVCHRYLQDLSQGIDTLNTLQAYYPDYGRTYQELGHCYRAQAKFAEAISAYQQAVQLHPGLLASWQQLALLFGQINEPKLVQEAQDKIQEIQSLPKYLLAAQSAFYEGRLAKAETLTREFLQKNPSHVPGMRLLAKIAVKLNILDDAQILLENATVIAPHSTDLKLELIQVLQQRQLFSKAHELALQTYLDNPKHALSELAYANQCVAIGNTTIAINHFTNVLSELTSHAAVYVQRGHAYKTIGEPDKAIADYVQASELKPDFGDAYWSLANLKTFVFNPPHKPLSEVTTINPTFLTCCRSIKKGCLYSDCAYERFATTFLIFSEYGRAAVILSCALRIFEAATISIAFVIFRVFSTLFIWVLISLPTAINNP